MEKLKPLYIACGNVKCYSTCGKVFWFLSKWSTELPHNPAIPLLDIYFKLENMELNSYFIQIFITALFTIVKRKKQPKQQKNEQNVVYILYYSAIKWHEILKHATSWRILENIMLARQNQTQKVIYCMVPLTQNI